MEHVCLLQVINFRPLLPGNIVVVSPYWKAKVRKAEEGFRTRPLRTENDQKHKDAALRSTRMIFWESKVINLCHNHLLLNVVAEVSGRRTCLFCGKPRCRGGLSCVLCGEFFCSLSCFSDFHSFGVAFKATNVGDGDAESQVSEPSGATGASAASSASTSLVAPVPLNFNVDDDEYLFCSPLGDHLN